MTTTARGIAQWRGLRAGAVRWRDWGAANQCTACLDSSALLPLPGTMPARQPRVHGRQPPPRRAIIHTDTGARADRHQAYYSADTQRASHTHAGMHAPSYPHHHTTTRRTFNNQQHASATNSTVTPHTHRHLPATAQRTRSNTIHAALNQQRRHTRARSIRQPHRTLLPLLACSMKLYMR